VYLGALPGASDRDLGLRFGLHVPLESFFAEVPEGGQGREWRLRLRIEVLDCNATLVLTGAEGLLPDAI
jgi:hypothetical protein